ncbi:MAG: 4Fe-4S binding protein [Thermoplasmata archaeon]|nr:4Fe-4S binding protein [Thermoplasmata archaeon]
MVTHAFFELLKQFFKDPVTNRFPVTHAPHNVHQTLKAVEAGKAQLNPPVPIPPFYRGKIKYDRDACIGCQMCIKVCPSQTIEFIPDDRKVLFYMSRCTFCQMCVDICPKDCIRMTDQFIMANLDKYGDDMIVKDSGPFVEQEKKEAEAKAEEAEEKAPAPIKKPKAPARKGKISGEKPVKRGPPRKKK